MLYTNNGDSMKKSILFLINGLGIEKAGSYSIAIDQCMPNLSRTKETSFFTTAVIDSVEYRSAYERFFLGDTYNNDLKYLEENILGDSLPSNPTFQGFSQYLQNSTCKLHVFLEPSAEKIVDQVNNLVEKLSLDSKREVYLHLILTQQTVSEYKKLIDITNYIQYHIDSRIRVGFILGKERFQENMPKEDSDFLRKLFFFCSAERWSDIEKKLITLKEENVRPCMVPGFCATNSCTIQNGDVILFFNTRGTSYDKYIKVIYDHAEWAFKTKEFSLPIYSIIQLDTVYNISYFAKNIVYSNSLSNLLQKSQKKALIITDADNMKLVNFLANGLMYIENPNIQFMRNDIAYFSNFLNVQNVIDRMNYDFIIFDYHMDVSKTINDLKEQLSKIDIVLGNVAKVCENKHSLIITSLYGLRKELPLAPYNAEMVTLDYELQIPIFFFDYTYPRSKYALFPGETNDILFTALRCIWKTNEIDSLIREKGLLTSLLKAFQK